jgi:hypothetical protein
LGHCYSVPISFAWCSSSLGHWFFVPLALLDTPPHWLIVYFIFFQLALHDANLRDGSRPFLGLVKHSKKIPSASGGYPISIIIPPRKEGMLSCILLKSGMEIMPIHYKIPLSRLWSRCKNPCPLLLCLMIYLRLGSWQFHFTLYNG